MLETERLVLRRWCDADRDSFARLNADPEVMHYFPKTHDRKYSDTFIDKMQEHLETHGYTLLACERKEEGDFIGFVGLLQQTFEARFTPAVEVGWRLHKHAWGQGYATEAAKACLRWGFEEHKLDDIVSMTYIGNQPSIRVMQKIGMKYKMHFDHSKLPGHWLEKHILYTAHRVDWRAE